MLTRRHIRARVLQAVYAYRQGTPGDVAAYSKNFLSGLDKIKDLYAIQASLLQAVVRMAAARIEARRTKLLASPEDLSPNTKFAENPFTALLEENRAYAAGTAKYASMWADHSEFVENVLRHVEESPRYGEYMASADVSFAAHKRFIIHVFKHIIAPDEALSDYYEDCNMDWAADLQVANTMLLKTLEDVKEGEADFYIPALYKDRSDAEFARKLLVDTIENGPSWHPLIEAKAENWDPERIALVDFILMEMAITEFVLFPSIPTKVTLNEYIELAKDYSTPKSRVFVNGILDRVREELTAEGKIIKSGRGLM